MRKMLIKALSAASILAVSATADLPTSEIEFPRDFGGHLSNTAYDSLNIYEYWYYTGQLMSVDSTNFSYSCAVFAAEFPLPTGEVVTSHWAHMMVIDQDRSILYAGDAYFNNDNIRYSNEELDVNYNDQFILKGYFNNIEQVNCKVLDETTGKELELALFIHPTNEQILYPNGNGVIDIPGEGNGLLYSKTNQPTSGTVKIGTKTYSLNPVESPTWATHQWGDYFPVIGWDWFTVALDNGINGLVYLHADQDRNIIGGTVTLNMPDGTTRAFGTEDIIYEKFNYWTSPKYGYTYPLNYRITIPEVDLTLMIDAKFAEQEVNSMMDGIANVNAVYQGENIGGKGALNINFID